MEPWGHPDVSDTMLLIGTLFEINPRVHQVADDVAAIRWLLEDEEDDGQAEEEPGSEP
jgi:hypothetical protein